MAKITANGATEVARWELSVPTDWDATDPQADTRPAGQMVLCSDGRILRKSSIPGDGWKVAFKVGPALRTDPPAVERVLTRRGYTMRRI